MQLTSRRVLAAALADLAAHCDSTAADIAGRIGEPDRRLVFSLLARAEHAGAAVRWRPEGYGPWKWMRRAACAFCGARFEPAGPGLAEHPQPWCRDLDELRAAGDLPGGLVQASTVAGAGFEPTSSGL